VKYWEIIADNLEKAGMELGLGFSSGFREPNNLDCGRARSDGKRLVVLADES
jgi:hypothetical protein